MFTANAFMNPDLFRKPTDGDIADESTHAHQQYLKALEIARKAEYITIGITDTWGAKMMDGGTMASYEKIGYHRNTYALLKGFLDSGKLIKLFRLEHGKINEYHLNTASLYLAD